MVSFRLIPEFNWLAVSDGDPRAFNLYKNHYSFCDYGDGRRKNTAYRNRYLFAGPGEKMVLLNQDASALFVWRKFIDKSGQTGVCCAVFRNESDILSSTLILEAEHLARERWGDVRFYTYVNPTKVRSSNPGFCFIKAGWRRCGKTKARKLIILEKGAEECFTSDD